MEQIQPAIIQQFKIAKVEEMIEEEENPLLAQQIRILSTEDEQYTALPIKQLAKEFYTNPIFSQANFIQNHPLIRSKLFTDEELCNIIYYNNSEAPEIIKSMVRDDDIRQTLENNITIFPFANIKYFFITALSDPNQEIRTNYQQILLNQQATFTLKLFDDLNFIFDILKAHRDNIEFATQFLRQTNFNQYLGLSINAQNNANMQKSKSSLEFNITQFQLLLGLDPVDPINIEQNINAKNALLRLNTYKTYLNVMLTEHQQFFQQKMQILLADTEFVTNVLSSQLSSGVYGLEEKIILLNYHNDYAYMNQYISNIRNTIGLSMVDNISFLIKIYNQPFVQESIKFDPLTLQDLFIRKPNLLVDSSFYDITMHYTQNYPEQARNIFSNQLEFFMNNIEQLFIQNFIVNKPTLIEEMFKNNREFFMQRYATPFMQQFIENNQLRIEELFAKQQELLIVYSNIPAIQNFLMGHNNLDIETLMMKFPKQFIENCDNVAIVNLLNLDENYTNLIFQDNIKILFENRYKEYIINYCKHYSNTRDALLQFTNEEERVEFLTLLANH